MGYTVEVYMDLKVEKIEELKRAIENGEIDARGWPFDDLEVDEDGYLDIESGESRPAMSLNDFYDWLCLFEPRGYIEFLGEDGARWRVTFKDGRWIDTPAELNYQGTSQENPVIVLSTEELQEIAKRELGRELSLNELVATKRAVRRLWKEEFEPAIVSLVRDASQKDVEDEEDYDVEL